MKKRLLALLCVLALAMQPMAALTAENTGEENILISDNSENIENIENDENIETAEEESDESEEADASEEASEDEAKDEEFSDNEENSEEEINGEDSEAEEEEAAADAEDVSEADENDEQNPEMPNLFKEIEDSENDNTAEIYAVAAVDKTILSYVIANLTSNSLEEVASVNADDIAALKTELEELDKKADATQDEIDAAVAKAKSMFSAIEYNETVNIVSGNKFNTQDMLNEYFGGMQVADNDVTYTYGANTPSSIKTGKDSQCKKLADGKLDEYIPTASTDTTDVEVIYDFGEDYYILGTELFSGFYYKGDKKRNRRNVGSYTVYVSDDGVTYTPVSKAIAQTLPKETDDPTNADYMITTKTSFAAVRTRYVKIEIVKDENSAYCQLGEMVVKGFKIPPARTSLEAALKNCAGVDAALYTEKTYSAYKTAYDTAESLWFGTSSDADEMKAAAKALNAAYAALEIANGKYILSGNLKSQDDLMYYPGYTNYFASQATYTLADNSNWTEADTDNRLLGGSVDGAYPKWLYGHWEDVSGDITVDLHQTCYITGADLWTWEDTQCWIKTITVYVSADGVRWTEMGKNELAAAWENETTFTNHRRSIAFDKGMVGRYVKYELRGGAYQHNPGEIVVMGIPGTVENEGVPAPVGSTDYVDSTGSYLYTLEGLTEFTAKGNVINNGQTDMDVRIITAIYNENGELIDSVWTDTHIGGGSAASYTNNFTGLSGMNAGCSVKTFAWEKGANGEMIPVSQIKGFGTLN